jgi:hypothetical protein
MTTFSAGRKRMYIDRKAAKRRVPAIVVEVNGVKHHGDGAEWPGNRFVHGSDDEAPAYWVETDAEVTLT